ncbi:MAG: hypothetical protein D6731_10805 [Planctomycetota bacterium]|nr:MAG: hypothetical protein D6731_10805 [Planctomycetota bacterium]
MIQRQWFGLATLGLGAAGLLCAGCAERSDRYTALSSGTGAITSDQVVGAALAGRLPGIPGLSDLADLGNLQGPAVEILAPQRAELLPIGPVRVQAKVEPGVLNRAPREVHVNGVTVPFAPDGTLSTQVSLRPGPNTIVVEAWDAAGRRSERHVTVLAGTLADESTALPSSASLRITDDGLDLLEPQLDDAIEAQRSAITQAVLAAPLGKNARARGFRYGRARAAIDATSAGVAFVIDVPSVELDFQVKVKILLLFSKTKRGTIRAANLRIAGVAQLGVDANGKLTATLGNVQSQVSGFQVPDFARKYRSDIERAFLQGFASEGKKQIEAALQSAFAAAPSTGSLTQTLLGQRIRAEWRTRSVRADDWGLTAVLGGTVRAENPQVGNAGSWSTGGQVANLIGAGPGWNGAGAVHQDIINRTLHAAWRAGALRLDLDAGAFRALGVAPPNTSQLISTSPGLASLIPAGVPIAMRAEAKLPPLVRVRPGRAQPFDLVLPCIQVESSYVDPQSGQRTSMGRSHYTIETQVSLQIAGGALRLVPAGPVRIFVDLSGQALPGTEALLTRVADDMAGPLLRAGLANLPPLPFPALGGLTLPQAQVLAEGESIVVFGPLVPSAPRTP